MVRREYGLEERGALYSGTQRGQLKKRGGVIEDRLAGGSVRVEVKRVDSLMERGFILCGVEIGRKKKAIHDRFEQRIEEALIRWREL
jgi:hypothetical protein